ncbi:hypothetical protein QQS21_006014 [Conoideocrella luteorostrata]|uniref:Aminoglycoside phosphotransferase domain-containing protein n=1 Tax=Conoideocrella luteorostrata TaxID=1105319 RepID=A0AAJ0FYF4_9HYPO|nr:hypothetical protein QQS21_006014 [Conoideocrella luteorostrata]
MAHDGLRSLDSPTKAPAMYYGCQVLISYKGDREYTGGPVPLTYLVMDYIHGKTAGQLLQDSANDEEAKDRIYRQIAFAISELHRIPVPQGSRPAAVNGGKIRHEIFEENQASCHYRNVTELENHLNLFLSITKSQRRVKKLAQEPMVFCYSDIWLENFIIDDDGTITIVDFEDASILPASFSRYTLAGTKGKIRRDIRDIAVVPKIKGIDNTFALMAAAHPMMNGWGSFARAGRKLLGHYAPDEPDQVHKVVRDAQGQPVIFAIELPERSQDPLFMPQLPTFTGPPSLTAPLPPPPPLLPLPPPNQANLNVSDSHEV